MAFPARVSDLSSLEFLQGRIIASLQIALNSVPVAANQAGLTGVAQGDLMSALDRQNAKHSEKTIGSSRCVSAILLPYESRAPKLNHSTGIDTEFLGRLLQGNVARSHLRDHMSY
jgi:hypothetical protein